MSFRRAWIQDFLGLKGQEWTEILGYYLSRSKLHVCTAAVWILREVMDKELPWAVERIRDKFFQRWDRKHERIVADEHPELTGDGRCDNKGKMIIIFSLRNIDMMLIHEICHAVASIGHNKKWQSRMEKAALKAESLGQMELAREIRADLHRIF